MIDGANTVLASRDWTTARSATALARMNLAGLWVSALSVEKNRKRFAPASCAASSSRTVAKPASSSIDPARWSRITLARWITVSTSRNAWRNESGSPRSPSAICTRTRSGPSRRGSRTRQRTDRPSASSRRSSARPTVPVAPVSSSIGRSVPVRARSVEWSPRRSWAGLFERTQTRRNRTNMAYVIAEPCIGTKDNSCVEVCPVDCIHPTPDEPDYGKVEMIYIDPEECIDGDACVEACPVDACFAEDQLPDEWQKYAKLNSDYYKA